MDEDTASLNKNRAKRRKTQHDHDSANEDSTNEGSGLLALPRELRDHIYGFCLEEELVIDIEDATEPPLVQTCRQIRKEARSLWYTLNVFNALVFECDATLLNAWVDHIQALEDSYPGIAEKVEASTLVSPSDIQNWDNLLKWCKALYNKRSYKMTWVERKVEKTQIDRVVLAAHKIVQQSFSSWEECERALENLHFVVKAYDPDWE